MWRKRLNLSTLVSNSSHTLKLNIHWKFTVFSQKSVKTSKATLQPFLSVCEYSYLNFRRDLFRPLASTRGLCRVNCAKIIPQICWCFPVFWFATIKNPTLLLKKREDVFSLFIALMGTIILTLYRALLTFT